ncbi:MAG: galactokinase, partial [Chthonomonadales bacterium]
SRLVGIERRNRFRAARMRLAGLVEAFTSRFGFRPEFGVRAPGRVNLIGEHTDYNDGYVLPCAINREMLIAGSSRPDNLVTAVALDLNAEHTFTLDDICRDEAAEWADYLKSMILALQANGLPIKGMDIVFSSTVPIGSGLSSSAAFQMASSMAIEAAGDFQVDPIIRAKLGQEFEGKFVGVNVGIMDHFVSSNGAESCALFLDTRSLDYRLIPFPSSDAAIVIMDTRKRRGLVDSEYNQRRADCQKAVSILQQVLPGITALRDVTIEQLLANRDLLEETVFKRAHHIVTENDRVLKSIEALESNDLKALGKLMNESHESLRYDYNVSCHELDTIVGFARAEDGVFGARMTGAGFGGCAVALVKPDAVDVFVENIEKQYETAIGVQPGVYACLPANGASRLF